MKVSILIPCRNEEKNLPILLHSLEKLSYPISDFEILFANDESSDLTSNILHDFASKYSHVKVIDIQKNQGYAGLKGKTRALDLLSDEALGEFFLFTDADIELPPNWIEGMLAPFIENEKMGVVIGVTGMKPDSFEKAMQGIEWLTTLYILHILSTLKIKGTGMGNNMAVRKSAFEAIGTYKKVGFSIVEDYALYKAIVEDGYEFEQLFNNSVLAYTQAAPKFFEQRKRWIQGGLESKSSLIFMAILASLFLPILVLMGVWKPLWSVFFLLTFFSIQFLITRCFEKKLRINGYLKYLPIFVFYLPISWFLQFAYYFLGQPIVWKGRHY